MPLLAYKIVHVKNERNEPTPFYIYPICTEKPDRINYENIPAQDYKDIVIIHPYCPLYTLRAQIPSEDLSKMKTIRNDPDIDRLTVLIEKDGTIVPHGAQS